MTDITPAELASWRALCEAATEGPWMVHSYHGIDVWDVFTDTDAVNYVCGPKHQHDAAFIAAARTAVPRLLTAYEALQRENAALRPVAEASVTFRQAEDAFNSERGEHDEGVYFDLELAWGDWRKAVDVLLAARAGE